MNYCKMKTVSAFYVSLNSKSCVRKTRFENQFEVKYEYLNKSRSMALFIRIMQGKLVITRRVKGNATE